MANLRTTDATVKDDTFTTTYQRCFKSPRFDSKLHLTGMATLTPRGIPLTVSPSHVSKVQTVIGGSLSNRGPAATITGAGGTIVGGQQGLRGLGASLAATHNASAVVPVGQAKKKHASLGILRLDYDYPPAPGDIDSPESFEYDVFYRVVPGFTFEMCQSGKLSPEVEEHFKQAVQWLVAKGVSGITGDCGFMMYFQQLARRITNLPVFMSSLAQLPAVTCAYAFNEKIAIFTANGKSLAPMRSLIKEECGVDPDEKRFIIVGCQDVPGFEQVALGGKVDIPKVTPGMVNLAKKVIKEHPDLRAFLFECTELGPYSDAVRMSTGLPVYDAITGCNFFIAGMKDAKLFGIDGWQKEWDGEQAGYKFGANLSAEERRLLVNKA